MSVDLLNKIDQESILIPNLVLCALISILPSYIMITEQNSG